MKLFSSYCILGEITGENIHFYNLIGQQPEADKSARFFLIVLFRM